MKVLLIENYYADDFNGSIQRYAALMQRGLEEAGYEVRLVRPPVLLGRLRRGETGIGKWIGYLDRYILYPPLLRWQARWADVVHICVDPVYIRHLRRKPHVFTCHDMLPIKAMLGEIRESKPGWTGRLYQRWALSCIRKAMFVVCVSKQTWRDVRRIAGLPDERLAVIENGLNYPYRPMERNEALLHLCRLGVDEPFLLHVGGNQWYKNRTGVLKIFAELIKKPGYGGHRLVMAGKPLTREIRELVAQLGLKGRLHELASVSNEDLRALYSMATALLFPSLQEGFGWPIIEAQACGCPVITTNRPPMTDIGGDAAIYIDPGDVRGSVEIVCEVLGKSIENLRLAGFRNAARFSPKAMIFKYVDCYESVLDRGGTGKFDDQGPGESRKAIIGKLSEEDTA